MAGHSAIPLLSTLGAIGAPSTEGAAVAVVLVTVMHVLTEGINGGGGTTAAAICGLTMGPQAVFTRLNSSTQSYKQEIQKFIDVY